MITAILSLAAVAAAVPVARQSGPTDVQILNYALTLEHLENNFYKAGLANFTAADFEAAGALPNFYANLQEISSDEQTHVDFLSGALKSAAVAPCSYAFPVTDAKSFLAVSQILEGVGVSAYLGAAQFIASKDYLTAAGAILTVEARHSSYIRANLESSPFPSAFDIPLDFDEVYSLAAQFITGCPSTNAPLPVMAFPALAASPGTPAKVGDKITLTAAKSVEAKAAYFITILGPVEAPLSGSGTTYTITVPEGVQMGQEYLVLTSAAGTPSDENIVAGPAVIPIADNIQLGATGTSPAPSPSGSSAPAGYGTYGSYGSYPSAPAGYGTYGSYGSYPAASPAPSSAPVSQIGDGQVQAKPVQQIGDGQVQANPVQQIGDGQVQSNPVQQIGDGQVQSNPVQQIGDGQVQSNPVQQIGDGQVQSNVQQIGDGQVQTNPVQQIGDGQVQAKPVQQIGDGQVQSKPPKN